MRVCDQEDRDKVLALNRQTVAGFRIKFEVDGETPDQKLKPSVGLVKAGKMPGFLNHFHYCVTLSTEKMV